MQKILILSWLNMELIVVKHKNASIVTKTFFCKSKKKNYAAEIESFRCQVVKQLLRIIPSKIIDVFMCLFFFTYCSFSIFCFYSVVFLPWLKKKAEEQRKMLCGVIITKFQEVFCFLMKRLFIITVAKTFYFIFFFSIVYTSVF